MNLPSGLASMFPRPHRLRSPEHTDRRRAAKVWQQSVDVAQGWDQISGKSDQRTANAAQKDQEAKP